MQFWFPDTFALYAFALYRLRFIVCACTSHQGQAIAEIMCALCTTCSFVLRVNVACNTQGFDVRKPQTSFLQEVSALLGQCQSCFRFISWTFSSISS
jgi:hypothetical protein